MGLVFLERQSLKMIGLCLIPCERQVSYEASGLPATACAIPYALSFSSCSLTLMLLKMISSTPQLLSSPQFFSSVSPAAPSLGPLMLDYWPPATF